MRGHPDAAADDRTVAERSRPVPPSPSSDSSLVMTPAIDAYVAELSQAEPRRSEVDSGVPEPGGWETLLSPVDPQRSDVDSGVPESGGSETLLSQTDRPAPRRTGEESSALSGGALPGHDLKPSRRERSRSRGVRAKRQTARPPHPGPILEPGAIPERSAISQHSTIPQSATIPQPAMIPQSFGMERSPAIESSRSVEWPSAKDILASHQAAVRPRPVASALARKTPGKKTRPAAVPTLAQAPGQWSPPVWLAGPPAAAFVLAAGIAGCFLSWRWALDSYGAAIVTDRLLMQDRTARSMPLPESVSPPSGSWVSSTAGHVGRWAIYLSHFQGERSLSSEETTALLERALQVSPLDRAARPALAQLEPRSDTAAVPLRSLGLSRDAVSLTLSCPGGCWPPATRKPLCACMAGRSRSPCRRTRSARAYRGSATTRPFPAICCPVRTRSATSCARSSPVTSGVCRIGPACSRRTRLFTWLPRILREQSRGEADAMLELVLGKSPARAASDLAQAMTTAARAEALALRSEWRDADRLYREAIELAGDETIRRSWWFNLADIALRLEDDDKRQAALQAAMAVAASDDIRRRAADIQRAVPPAGPPDLTGRQGQLNK